jgi:hypothetical protein
MDRLPDLSSLTHDEKDALIRALWAQVQTLTAQVATLQARVAALDAKLGTPPKTPETSSLPPSQGQKPNWPDKPARTGPRQGRQPGSPWRRPTARRSAGRDRHRPPGPLRALPSPAGRGRPDAGRPPRQDRPARGRAVGDAGGALRRALPRLRRHHPGPLARGVGARHAVQPAHHRPGAVPALRPPRQLSAAQPSAAGPVRPRHQRGRAGCGVPPRQAALRHRGRRHSGPAAPGARDRVRRFEALPRTACASTGAAAGTGCSRTRRW